MVSCSGHLLQGVFYLDEALCEVIRHAAPYHPQRQLHRGLPRTRDCCQWVFASNMDGDYLVDNQRKHSHALNASNAILRQLHSQRCDWTTYFQSHGILLYFLRTLPFFVVWWLNTQPES